MNCPKCKGRLFPKHGKFGDFLGCENYPTCHYTFSKTFICPDCGGRLIFRETEEYKGRIDGFEVYDNEEFLGCSNYPKCHFTKSLDSLFTTKGPVKCLLCNDRGLVPSKALGKFSGKPIPNCFEVCVCKEDEHEYYIEPRPEDFDFPMSYNSYRSLCQQHGWHDPGPDRPIKSEEVKSQVVEHIVRHSNMGKKEFDLLQQTANEITYLRSKLDELQTRRKPRGKY